MPFIFLSYSHKDSEYANRLADTLEAKGLDVWIDEHIDYGGRWPQAIQENLDRCSAFVVVMTPDSFESDWVQAELTRARRLRKPTFPLLLAGEVWLALESRQYVDVRGAKLPPARFYDELAEILFGGQPPAPASSVRQQERLRTELGELQRRYANLTSRLGAVDTDLDRALDSEQKLTLEERRVELAGKRNEVSARMAQIERELSEEEARAQAARASEARIPSADAAQVEAKRGAAPAGRPRRLSRPNRGWWGLAGLLGAICVLVVALIVSKAGGFLPPNPMKTLTAASTERANGTPPIGTALTPGVIPTLIITQPIEMELVRVPAGQFLMGSDPSKDTYAQPNELDQHLVDLPEFYIGKYEVTNVQYRAFVKATGHEVPAHWVTGDIPAGKEQHPVVDVSWYDAQAFIEWLSSESGIVFRLPTEAEWEKSCRGTEGSVYPWGDSAPDSATANFDNNVRSTTSVGTYSPKGDSPYGAADMAGNVWEWTGSLNKPYPYDATDGREDQNISDDRMVRGGSYGNHGGLVRCAFRSKYDPYLPEDRVGFRVCTLIQQE